MKRKQRRNSPFTDEEFEQKREREEESCPVTDIARKNQYYQGRDTARRGEETGGRRGEETGSGNTVMTQRSRRRRR
ncbi:hypothetical protein PIB30_021007 [Stylosanthes scabra]|uniref:Uncharacterized protein n=1 Tax=Stylosanthes scabra TaxID=79078 RepID=A0ABU6T8H8_9FABA|nr:hypothetical protein [Stylosanthes scabra]